MDYYNDDVLPSIEDEDYEREVYGRSSRYDEDSYGSARGESRYRDSESVRGGRHHEDSYDSPSRGSRYEEDSSSRTRYSSRDQSPYEDLYDTPSRGSSYEEDSSSHSRYSSRDPSPYEDTYYSAAGFRRSERARAPSPDRVHDGDMINIYACKICYHRFRTAMQLREHQDRTHRAPSEYQYHCRNCDRSFPTRSDRELHEDRRECSGRGSRESPLDLDRVRRSGVREDDARRANSTLRHQFGSRTRRDWMS